MGYYSSGMSYFSKRSLPCSLHLRLSTPQFSIRITSTVLSGGIPDFSPIHNCNLIVLQSIALTSAMYHNYIAIFSTCKIVTWYFLGGLGVFCTMEWYFFRAISSHVYHAWNFSLNHDIICIMDNLILLRCHL